MTGTLRAPLNSFAVLKSPFLCGFSEETLPFGPGLEAQVHELDMRGVLRKQTTLPASPR